MNKSIIKLFAILGIIGAILGLIFSFLPISNLAIFPAAVGLILGFIAFNSAKKQGQNFNFPRIVVILALFAIIISVGKQLFTDNKVEIDTEFIEKEKQSEEDAVKELEEELDELEELE
ncbi:FUSC family protein [Urechidicola vernalis]|uniref:FUSC family protein n=1 Tax=Urechidicola vernalis TaxID=3075600 RepID=A0ABU2Y4U5_9FLAO|nr:FUSC family protein [Urechidicola sp. P050]MDT0552295.1 FUSC family protein [Urechidicola sp. P050]